MSDLSLALIAGAVGLAVFVWSLVSQYRWRRGHISDTRRRNLDAIGAEADAGTCPAFLVMPDDHHKPCIRERGHEGYHRWHRVTVGS